MAPLILIVDDEISNRRTLTRVLQREGFSIIEAKDGEEALQQLHQNPTLMITDLKMPKVDGMELLTRAREEFPHTEVILMTAFGTIDLAVQAMRKGAWDFIPKPIKRAELIRAVHKAIQKYDLTQENRALKKALAKALPKDWIGSSAQMDMLNVQALQAANSMASILLLGESGTGKSKLAQHIHQNSPRADRELVTINCGAIPESLMESELFGHEAGAFTGAKQQRKGRFELAHNGTLFLDEITELSPQLQVKLLRVLQDGAFERVGGSKTLTCDVRIIAASNRDPQEAIREKQLREDLYYRLNVVQLKLPPLRDRNTDVPALARHFAQVHAQRNRRPFKEISNQAMNILCGWPWPGNVRELENVVERAVVLSQGDHLYIQDLPFELQGKEIDTGDKFVFSMGTPLKDIEREVIVRTLKMVDGDKNRAAEILGITARTIYRREAEWKEES